MREWYRNYPSVGCGGTGDRKGRPYGPDKGGQGAVEDAGPYKGMVVR